MDKLQISQIIKELVSQGYPEPIIGGTCSLFLQGFEIEPGDIDLYYALSKEEFLNQVHHRRCPKFSVSIDWNFYPNLDLRFQEIDIEGVKLRVQKIEDVLDYKLEGLEEEYFPESKRDKHLKFFKKLILDPRVSSNLKSRINQILNIMPKNIENFHDSLSSIKDQLFDAPNEVKAAFNTIVGWFDTQYFGKSSKSSMNKSNPYDEARLYRDSAFKKVSERFDFDDPKDCKKFVSLYKKIFNAIKKVAKPGDFKDPTSLWAKKLINQIISNYPDFNIEDIGSLNVDLSHFGGYGNKFELLAKPTSENEDKYGYSLVIADLNNKY